MFVTLNLDAQVACGVCKDTLSRNIYGDILRPGAPKLADWDELSMRVGALRKAWLNYQAKYPQPKPEIAAAVAVLHWRWRRRNQPALALPETESDEEDRVQPVLRRRQARKKKEEAGCQQTQEAGGPARDTRRPA